MDPINELILNHPNLEALENEVRNAAELITECFNSGGKLLLCGNGGSCADCEHIAGEMVNQFAKDRPLSTELADKLDPSFPVNCMGTSSITPFNDWISYCIQ